MGAERVNVLDDVNMANATSNYKSNGDVLKGFFDLIAVAVLISNAGMIFNVLYS